MTVTLTDLMIYTMVAIFGLMIIDFIIAFFKSFSKGSFTTFLNYLKDILYYVLPLYLIMSMIPFDPTGWILVVVYFLGGISVIIKYVLDIKNRF
jgi:hypothetical protein